MLNALPSTFSMLNWIGQGETIRSFTLPKSLSSDSLDSLSLKVTEKITAIKEMASYVVADFNYETGPIIFKRTVDDIFTTVTSGIKWSRSSYSESELKKSDLAEPMTFNDDRALSTNFYCVKNKLNTQICETIRSVGDYSPPWWYNAHLGTIFSFGSDPHLKYYTEEVEVRSRTTASTAHFSSPSLPSLAASTSSSLLSNSCESPGWEGVTTENFVETDRFNLDWYPSKPKRQDNEKINIVVFIPGLGLSSKNVGSRYQMASSSF